MSATNLRPKDAVGASGYDGAGRLRETRPSVDRRRGRDKLKEFY